MVEGDAEFELRVARFMGVQARTEQSAFREAVFRAFEGKCAVSGCDVPEAVDAARRIGPGWPKDHESPANGILLRRDLRALYDARLLRIDDEGVVELMDDLAGHYGNFRGVTAREAATSLDGWEPLKMNFASRPVDLED